MSRSLALVSFRGQNLKSPGEVSTLSGCFSLAWGGKPPLIWKHLLQSLYVWFLPSGTKHLLNMELYVSSHQVMQAADRILCRGITTCRWFYDATLFLGVWCFFERKLDPKYYPNLRILRIRISPSTSEGLLGHVFFDTGKSNGILSCPTAEAPHHLPAHLGRGCWENFSNLTCAAKC